MKSEERLPTLITIRSAEAWRDAGIRFAYLKAGIIGALALLIPISIYLLWILQKPQEHDIGSVWLMLGLVLALMVSIALCARAMEFPHFPRMTLEELEIMRVEMGIPAHVFKQTHDSVLHGSSEEVRAGMQTNELIEKLKKSG